MIKFFKYIFFFFLTSTIIISTAVAQTLQSSPDSLFNIFSAQDDEKIAIGLNDVDAYLCAVPASFKKAFLKEAGVKIKRQLNDTVFIISFNDQHQSPYLIKKFSWIKKANNLWKLSPDFLNQLNNKAINFPVSTIISTAKNTNDKLLLVSNLKFIKSAVNHIFTVSLKNYSELTQVLNCDLVNYIGALATHPKEELQINDLDLSVNKINMLHSDMPDLNGDGITVSIKENLPDTSDIDYAASYAYNPLAAINYSSHATTLATMVAGAGNSYYLGKGVASGSTITSSNFNNLLPDADSNYRQFHITVQNHSYGVGIENFYGADAAAYDLAAKENDSLLFVFSSGNSGNLSATSGRYKGILKFANSTGSFKMAKNIITVGAVDSFGVVASTSSRGPAYDGRVLPTIVAYGEDGTSGAAALVSGTTAILQQAFKASHNNQLPSSALLKAVLINTADAVNNIAPSFTSGYGNLNIVKAVKTIKSSYFFEGKIADNSIKNFQINIPPNISKVKFTLVWNDEPAQANAYTALVNDLDMELLDNLRNQRWLPWVLNSSANTDSLSVLPIRKRDSLNTIEQITVDNPVAGAYQLVIKGSSVSSPDQSFYIAYQFDTLNTFKWNFPASADNIFPGVSNLLRWESNFSLANASIFYSLNNGSDWQKIDTNINGNKFYYYWNAPDTNALAILKMETNTKVFYSEPFSISSKLNIKVGFNCADSVMLYWNKLPGILNYKLFTLQGKYLQPITIISDTTFVFDKKKLPFLQFAVVPVIGTQTGVKSYTTNYSDQGVNCYVSNFLADLKNDSTTSLQLELGSDHLIKKIEFQKLQKGVYITLQGVDLINGLHYNAIDNFLQQGVNTYRAHIILTDGRDIYSAGTSVFYFKNTSVSVYPNPILQNNYVSIQLKNLNNQIITISDIMGRVVYKKQANNNTVKILLNYLKGIYIITITDTEIIDNEHFKILIL